MPDLNGLDVARQISNLFPEIPILMVTIHLSKQLAEERAGPGFAGPARIGCWFHRRGGRRLYCMRENIFQSASRSRIRGFPIWLAARRRTENTVFPVFGPADWHASLKYGIVCPQLHCGDSRRGLRQGKLKRADRGEVMRLHGAASEK